MALLRSAIRAGLQYYKHRTPTEWGLLQEALKHIGHESTQRKRREEFQSSRQLSVLDSMRCFRRNAQALFPIGLVIGVVTFKPKHLTIAFKRENVRSNPIEKPAIVRDNNCAACEVLQCFLK